MLGNGSGRIQRMNRALRVGKLPNIAVDILNRLANANLDTHFRAPIQSALEVVERVFDGSSVTHHNIVEIFNKKRKCYAYRQFQRP